MHIFNFLKKNNYFFLFFCIVILYIYGKGQLTHVYAQLDDWEFATSLPQNMENHGTPWDKTLWEGRWINFLWSKIAVHLTLNELYIFFIAGYSLLCWSASLFISNNQYYRIIISFLFFLCPTYADLSLWPATISPSVWLSSFVLLSYKFCKNIFISFFLLIAVFLSYPPATAICFVFICLSSTNYKQIIYYTIFYFITYALSITIIYALNYYYHGLFGVQIADWRHPHPIKNLHDIFYNVDKALEGLKKECFDKTKYIFFAILSIITSVLFKKDKKFILKIILISNILITIDFLLLILAGTDAVGRSIIWPWFSIVSLFFYNSNFLKTKLSMIASIVSILIFIGYANSIWNQFYLPNVKRAQLAEYYGTMLLSANSEQVYFCGDISKTVPYYNSPYFEGKMAFTLHIWKDFHIQLINYDKCSDIKDLGLHKVKDIFVLKIN